MEMLEHDYSGVKKSIDQENTITYAVGIEQAMR